MMLTNPLYRRTKDGHKVLNDLCTNCSFIADNPDLADMNLDVKGFEDEGYIDSIINQHIRMQDIS